jgi:hypothetical protein
MKRAKCVEFCPLCHGDRTPYNLKNHDTTKASRLRNIAIFNEQRARGLPIATRKSILKKEKTAPRQGAGFLDLPAEIRIQIYTPCLQKSTRYIYGHIEGGGYHKEYAAGSYHARKLNVWADDRFLIAVFLLNKAVYAEAQAEIYKLISFVLETRTSKQMPYIHY